MISDKDIEKASAASAGEPAEGSAFRFSWANFACALAFTLAMCILFCGGIA